MLSTMPSPYDETIYSLLPYLEDEIKRALLDLDANYNNSPKMIQILKNMLPKMLNLLTHNGFIENICTDIELRSPYVIMQSLIERAIVQSFLNEKLSTIRAAIITPRMSTPLTMLKGEELSEINISDPSSYARLRNLSLTQYLKCGGLLSVIYSHNAKSALSNEKTMLANHDENLSRYENLVDVPNIKIDMDKFPADMTGAVYKIDNTFITVESKQITQIDDINKQLWTIRIGQKADDRISQIDKFLKENDVECISKW